MMKRVCVSCGIVVMADVIPTPPMADVIPTPPMADVIPTPPAPCICDWVSAEWASTDCETFSDDGSGCYDYCCGGSPTPKPDPPGPTCICNWVEEEGCFFFEDDGSLCYKECCGTSTQAPKPATTPAPLQASVLDSKPPPPAPCSCAWASAGCETFSDDGSACYAYCCGGSPTPKPDPPGPTCICTWAEEQGCENIEDDGSLCYKECCGTSTQAPRPAKTPASFSAVPTFAPRQAPVPDRMSPPPAPCSCDWASAGCETFSDDGSVCFAYCCPPPCSCDWASAGCETFKDDGSVCYAYCCKGSPTDESQVWTNDSLQHAAVVV